MTVGAPLHGPVLHSVVRSTVNLTIFIDILQVKRPRRRSTGAHSTVIIGQIAWTTLERTTLEQRGHSCSLISQNWEVYQDMHLREWNNKVLGKSAIKKGVIFQKAVPLRWKATFTAYFNPFFRMDVCRSVWLLLLGALIWVIMSPYKLSWLFAVWLVGRLVVRRSVSQSLLKGRDVTLPSRIQR